MLAVVSASSVRSGRTSLIAPTRVVLPDPKPPAMRIFCAMNTGAGASECAEPIQYLPKHVIVRPLAGGSSGDYGNRALPDEIGEQHADHAHRQPEVGSEVGHG